MKFCDSLKTPGLVSDRTQKVVCKRKTILVALPVCSLKRVMSGSRPGCSSIAMLVKA